MSGDVAIPFNGSYFDFAISPSLDIASTSDVGISDLQNSVSLSLFTDRTAPSDFVWRDKNIRPRNRGGFWFDAYRPFPIGSWLWLIPHGIFADDNDLLTTANNYCSLALQWLIDYNIATSVTPTTSLLNNSTAGLYIQISIVRPDSTTINFQYDWAWTQIFNNPSVAIPTIQPGYLYFILGESSLNQKLLG